MERPLWQILLSLFALSFAVHRAAVVSALSLGSAEPALLLGYAVQCGLGLLTALGIWLGRVWACGALLALGAAVAAGLLVEGVALGLRPPAVAVSQVLVTAVATGALCLLLRREFASGRAG